MHWLRVKPPSPNYKKEKFTVRDLEEEKKQLQQPMVAEGERNVATKGNHRTKVRKKEESFPGISISATPTNPSR